MAVCKGIEAYEIFTKAIMTPWTERAEEEGEERGGEERRRGGGDGWGGGKKREV